MIMFVGTMRKITTFSLGAYVIAAMFQSIEGFIPSNLSRSEPTYQITTLNMDPALIAAAAGLAGSAAGWASRSGEVAGLQRQKDETSAELENSYKELNTAKVEYEEKKEKYEKALYEMDTEFEGQTEKIKKDFQKKLESTKVALEKDYKTKLQRVKSKIEEDANIKLVETEGKLKQEFLQQKLAYEAEFNAKSAEDIIKALDKQSGLVSENKDLKDSLDKVQSELKEILKMKNRF